jgi:hypothetical protein
MGIIYIPEPKLITYNCELCGGKISYIGNISSGYCDNKSLLHSHWSGEDADIYKIYYSYNDIYYIYFNRFSNKLNIRVIDGDGLLIPYLVKDLDIVKPPKPKSLQELEKLIENIKLLM